MSKSDEDVLRTFRHWVRTLDWKDLQNSLAFRVRKGSVNDTSMEISKDNNNHFRPHHPCHRVNRDEYDMIQDMVRLQAPLPTPIHPRAVPYQPASQMGRNYI